MFLFFSFEYIIMMNIPEFHSISFSHILHLYLPTKYYIITFLWFPLMFIYIHFLHQFYYNLIVFIYKSFIQKKNLII